MTYVRRHWMLIAAILAAVWFFFVRKGAAVKPRLQVVQGSAL
jgi:hypothetical protein